MVLRLLVIKTLLVLGMVLGLYPMANHQAVAKTVIFHAHDGSHGWKPWLDSAKAEFEKANPDIEINIMPIRRQELIERLYLTYGTNDFPDVVEVFASTFYPLGLQGMFADLNPHMERTATLDWNDFFPVALVDATFDDKHSRAGERWMLPISMSVIGVGANEAHFAESGLDAFANISNDWTWNDFREIARKLTRVGVQGQVERYGAANWTFQQWVYNAGGWPFDSFFDPAEATLQTGPVLQAINFLRTMIHEDRTLLQQYYQLMGGRASLSTNVGPTLTPRLRADGTVPEWSIGPQPKLERQGTDVQVIGLAMYSHTSNPEAVWKWMNFLATERATDHIAQTGRPVPYGEVARRYVDYFDNPSPHEHIWIELISHPDAFGRPVVDPEVWGLMQDRIIRPGGILHEAGLPAEVGLFQLQEQINIMLRERRME